MKAQENMKNSENTVNQIVTKTNKTMEALTGVIRFKSHQLNEIITIEKIEGIWGFESTSGYCTHGSIEYKSFNQAYNEAKAYEKRGIEELKYMS